MKRPDAHAPDDGEKGAERKRFSVCLGCPDARGAHVHYEHDGREVYAAVPSPFEIAALRARIAELERVIGEIEKWVRGLIAYKPREVAKDDFAYDRLLNEVKRAAKQMKRLTAGALKASVR